MRLVIACRGSVEEGLGHLYRSASFAAVAERRHNIDVIALADAAFLPIFGGLRTQTRVVAHESALVDAVAACDADAVLIDMTDMDADLFRNMRRQTRILASISPVFRHAATLDMFFTRGTPPASLAGPALHAGIDYAIINASCRRIVDAQFETALAATALPIMVSFGGADADNHTRLTLETLREIERPLLIWVMLGDGYLHSHDELIETIRVAPRHEIIMARTNRSMWSVASNCALAILTSGMSTLEAIYAGLPVISIRRLADPSRQVETVYDRMCLDGGAFHDGSHVAIRTLIDDLHGDRARLRELRRQQYGLIDGLGAHRVLDAIERHVAAAKQ